MRDLQLILVRCGVDTSSSSDDRPRDMTKRQLRLISGLLSGSLCLTAIAQEPAAPAADQFKAPANVAAAPAEAAKTQSGLASLVLKKGTGPDKPSATDTVRVHYTGWQASDGTMFDSSLQRGQPAEFALNGMI